MDMPMAVWVAIMMGKLSPVPSDEQIALWREHLTSSMTDAVSACLEVITFGAFCRPCGRLRYRMRKRDILLHASGADACSNPARLRWPCRRRPGELQNRPHVRRTNVKVLLNRDSHVEMPPPTVSNPILAISRRELGIYRNIVSLYAVYREAFNNAMVGPEA